jgi:pyruvate dehydrogenase E1 component alpha subunit
MRRVLQPDGTLAERDPGIAESDLLGMYRAMVEARLFDQRMVSLQRQGRIGTYAPLSGQEAAQVGPVFALDPRTDWIFPTYRDYAAMRAFGMPLQRLVLFPMGHPDGGVAPPGVHVYPVSIAIASHLPHAVGAAYAARLRGEPAVFLAFLGDGATSEGDFHEAVNLAGVQRLPVVFWCENNGWAISVPRHRQTAARTLAQKAVAYGATGIQVDGNDLLAVVAVAREAVARSRAGEGPTLVECVTYRYGPHTTADDPTRYRSAEELERMEALDPIRRLEIYLTARGLWDEARQAELTQAARDRVAEAVAAAEAAPPPPPDFFFDIAYERPTRPLERQRAAFVPEDEA